MKSSYSFKERANIFRFFDKNSKTNLKFWKKKKLFTRPKFVELVETNPLMYNIKDIFTIKRKSSYLFEDRGTDGQPESISECTLKRRP